MNPRTGEVIKVADGEPLPDGFVEVPKHVYEAQLVGRRVLTTRHLRAARKRERQGRKSGRPK